MDPQRKPSSFPSTCRPSQDGATRGMGTKKGLNPAVNCCYRAQKTMETRLCQSPKGAPALARVNGEGGAIGQGGMRERVRVRLGVSVRHRSGRAPLAAWRAPTFGPSARLGQPV